MVVVQRMIYKLCNVLEGEKNNKSTVNYIHSSTPSCSFDLPRLRLCGVLLTESGSH